MKKKGQMKMSFGMIFTIILIVVFLVFSFLAIKKFLDFQEQVQIEKVFEKVQDDVTKMYKSTYGTKQLTYSLPSRAIGLCLYNTPKQFGMEFSKGPPKTKEIEYLDVTDALNGEERVCFKKEDGKVNFTISMDYGEEFVVVKN